LSSVQVMLLMLCFLVVAIGGFDTAAIGFIAPAIRADWTLTPAQLAGLFGSGLFGSGLFGLMAGAFAIGPVARSARPQGGADLRGGYSSGWREPRIGVQPQPDCSDRAALPSPGWDWVADAERDHADLGILSGGSFLVTLMFCGFTIGSATVACQWVT
jgi:MFS transporter, AAHS family, 4-hydroxybenzoate transporter